MNIHLDEHTFTRPIREYLKLADYSISEFLNQIYLNNNSLLESLSILAKYKAYDILIPFNIIVSLSSDEEYLKCWNNIINRMNNSNEIFNISKKLYQKLINSPKRAAFMNLNLYGYLYTFSIAEIENLVWKVCIEHFSNIYELDEDFGLCLFTAGLYSNDINNTYWKYIDKNIFPLLFEECKKIERSIDPNSFEIALMKRTIYIFCSELGVKYYNAVSHMIAPIISKNKEQFDFFCNNNLTENLQKIINVYMSYCINKNWIIQLECLYKYSEKYQLKNFSCKSLGLCLPVLLQCVGEYEEAAKKAISNVNLLSLNERSGEVILLALYIAMFTTPTDIQFQVGSVLENIFNFEYQLKDIIDVFIDIKEFYDKFTYELSMRFDKNGINQLKKNDDSFFYEIYKEKIPDIELNKKTGIEYVDDAYWLLCHLFKNKKLLYEMEELIGGISNEENKYSERLMLVSLFYRLFFALASHLDTEPRICVRVVCELVDISEDELEKLNDKNELFEIYNKKQEKELSELSQRLSDAYKNLPQYVPTRKYEETMALLIREKLMNLDKQVLASGSKKLLVVKSRKDNILWEK